MTPRTPLMIVLVACTSATDKVPVDTSPPLDTGPVLDDAWIPGAAPWDPLYITFADHTKHAPLVSDSEGEAVPVEALLWRDQTLGYNAVGDFAAGDYTIVGWEDTDEGWDDLSFTVSPYGRDPAFSADAVLGRVYEVDLDQLWAPVPGVGEIGLHVLEDVDRIYLRVASPSSRGDVQVSLELIVELQDSGDRCLLLRDSATLSETGELSWSLEDITVESESGDVQAWDLALHLGWLADGSGGGGLDGRGTVDTRTLWPWVVEEEDPFAVCEFVLTLSDNGCVPCPSDGAETCLDLRAYAGTLSPVDITLEDDLPMCGLDVESGLPSFSCDMPEIDLDCGCHAPLTRGAALPVSLSLLAFLRRRRGPTRPRAANPPSS